MLHRQSISSEGPTSSNSQLKPSQKCAQCGAGNIYIRAAGASFCSNACFDKFEPEVDETRHLADSESQVPHKRCFWCIKPVTSTEFYFDDQPFCCTDCVNSFKLKSQPLVFSSKSAVSPNSSFESSLPPKVHDKDKDLPKTNCDQLINGTGAIASTSSTKLTASSYNSEILVIDISDSDTEESRTDDFESSKQLTASEEIIRQPGTMSETEGPKASITAASNTSPPSTKTSFSKISSPISSSPLTPPTSSIAGNQCNSKSKHPPTSHYETYSLFDWDSYLKETGGKPAPDECFKQNIDPPANEFELNMKLEARDPRNSSSICIATVVALLGPRLKLRLDGTDNTNDFFELVDSENIHPSGYCQSVNEMLQPPLAFRRNPSQFPAFQIYVLKDARHAPESAFKKPPPAPKKNLFKVGMKLEAVDRKNPWLICPATIEAVNGRKVSISFDGWKRAINYDCDYTSRDLFPVGWCAKTGHPLQPPGDRVPIEPTKAKSVSNHASPFHTPPSSVTSRGESNHRVKLPSEESKKTTPSAKETLVSSSESKKSTNGVDKANGKNGKPADVSAPHEPPVRIKIALTKTTPDSKGNLKCVSGTSKSDTLNISASNSSTKRSYDQFSEDTALSLIKSVPAVKIVKNRAKNSTDDETRVEGKNGDSPVSSSHATSGKTKVEATESSFIVKPNVSTCSPENWSVDQVISHLKSVDVSLNVHADVFKSHEIDGKALMLLTSDMMMKFMGLKLGPALKICSIIEKLKMHCKRSSFSDRR